MHHPTFDFDPSEYYCQPCDWCGEPVELCQCREEDYNPEHDEWDSYINDYWAQREQEQQDYFNQYDY